MASTANVLTNLGDGPFVYREMNEQVGILTGPRTKPRIISQSGRGYYLGLYNEDWANQPLTISGTATYYVRIVPKCDDVYDVNGSDLVGTPTDINVTKGTTFTFLPFPSNYYCTGYKVYAGTTSTLYYQGELDGRYSNTFIIGTTWPYVTTTATLTAQTIGPPPFASLSEVYQLEGATSSRLFLGGGKKYIDGFAKVSNSSSGAVLTGGTGTESDYTTWSAISDGSFRMRLRRLESRGKIDSLIDFNDIDFSSVTDMDDVASILQSKFQSAIAPKLICGQCSTSLSLYSGISDGSFSLSINGTIYNFRSIDFSAITSMDDIATAINAKLVGYQAICRWDAISGRFYFEGLGQEIITNGGFSSASNWNTDVGWSIGSGKATDAGGVGAEIVSNGTFDSTSNWTLSSPTEMTISGGVARIYSDSPYTQKSLLQNLSFSPSHPSSRYQYGAYWWEGSGNIFYGTFIEFDGFRSSQYDSTTTFSGITGTVPIVPTYFFLQTYSTTIATHNDDFSSYFDNVSLKPIGALWQTGLADLANKTISVVYTISGLSAGASIKFHIFNPTTMAVGASGTARTSDGTYTETVSVSSASGFTAIMFENTSTTAGASIDNVSVKPVSGSATAMLSYLSKDTGSAGTDISSLIKGRESSTGVYLQSEGKASTSDTITWSTDHFVLSKATNATKSGSDMTATNGSRTATFSSTTFTSAQVGQLLKITGESGEYRITEVPSSSSVNLDVTYSGVTGTKTFTTVYNGADYQFDFAETCLANVGTDISTMLDMRSSSTSATYQPGQTANRSLLGQSTKWGEWAEGMKFRVTSEGANYIVNKVIAEDHIYLDSNYDGDALLGYQDYVLQPYSQQVYVSTLGNPFRFDVANIVPLPTEDSDELTAIKATGSTVALFMDHHIWMVDGVDVTAPRLIDSVHGCPYPNAAIAYKNACAIFTGHDFKLVGGSGTEELDAGERVYHLIKRMTTGDIDVHGVYSPSEKLLKWWIPIDDSTVPNTVFCYDPATGNWWLYNQKNALCSAIIRDSNKDPHVITGQRWDEAHSAPAFTLLHDTTYTSDGASQSSAYDRNGVINSVGTQTASAGYLTCGTCNAMLATFQAVTSGYFTVKIDGVERLIGPVDLSSAASLADVASLTQTSIRAETGGVETFTYDTDHFVLTSGTTTNISEIDYLRAGYNEYTDTDLSTNAYFNGREGVATKTFPVNTTVLNLYKADGTTNAALCTTEDGEAGIYVYVCDSNYRNGQYSRIVSNSATAITVTPKFETTPAAGWFWFIGGIVPTWLKWFDFGSPNHKSKIYSVAVTTRQNDGTTNNTMACHTYQSLSSTVRTTKTQTLGTGEDTTNTFKPDDQPNTQHGVKLIRPHTEYGLEIDDITITHRPIV